MDRRRRLLLMNNVRAKASGGGTPAPTLISLNTASGSTAGGTVVIATGTNLTGASAVSVGGNPATAVSALDASHVQFTTPAGSAGAASITVTTPGGTSAPLVGAFTYVAAPTLVSLNTSQGTTLGGTVIIATGTNLTGASAVSVGGNPATSVSALDATHVQFTTPAGSAGAASITVTTPGGTSSPLAGAFTYVVVVAPVLESISSDIGVAAGGTKQTIRGYGFTGTTGVTFNAVAATLVVVVSDNVVTCVTPSGTASETAVDVVITNSAGSSTLSAAFEYLPGTGTTYVSESFTGGTIGALTATGSPTVINVPSSLGTATKCVQCQTTSGGTEQSVGFDISPNPLNATYGLFTQAEYLVPSATLALLTTAGQVKTFLCRVNNTAPLTVMCGAGAQFSGAVSTFASYIDSGITAVLGSYNGAVLGDALWRRLDLQITVGRARGWMDGKKAFIMTNASIGSASAGTYTPRWGEVYTQTTPAGTLNILVAGVQAADHYKEPLYL